MATKIKLGGAERGNERRVTEDAQTVAARINSALTNNEKFVVLTDADSGKEFSLQPQRVASMEAE
jgi:hypothetical protein